MNWTGEDWFLIAAALVLALGVSALIVGCWGIRRAIRRIDPDEHATHHDARRG